ncbi:hypothetical protein [Nocardioides convexus]|uniref:hypothetical protein n=1 Tax=Nocardioides convexus TaxID=2712224 RepID=UPI0024184289|nr:hypothetical protein [Nocardioides convexus]
MPPPQRGRPDGRRRVAVDVDVRARGPGDRQAHLLLAQRGSRQGAAVRRLRARGAGAAALDARRPGPAAGRGGHRRGAGRRDRDPRPDAADGRRGAQPQPRRHADAAARPGAVARALLAQRRGGGRGVRVHGRQRPLLPQHRHARLQGWRSTRRATFRARRWWSRWPATARTSGSRSPAPATSGSPVRRRLADGLFLGDYGPDDANPDIGDSAITETAGIGGFAMAAAPAIVRFVGGTVPDALATSRRMREITIGENDRWPIPVLDFAGAATGIDVTSVCRTGILPQINTGMAGRVAGVGQVGAGLVTPPASIFPAALAESARRTRDRGQD